MILLTTSRRPTKRIRTFCHDVERSIPNVVRINRGKLNVDGIAEKALELNADRVIVVARWKGGPGKIELFQIGPTGLTSVPPLIYVMGLRLQREFGATTRSVQSLAIIASPEKLPQTTKIAESLSNFLNVPMMSMNVSVTEYEALMHISFGTSRNAQITFILLPQRIEIGPRIIISHVVWEFSK